MKKVRIGIAGVYLIHNGLVPLEVDDEVYMPLGGTFALQPYDDLFGMTDTVARESRKKKKVIALVIDTSLTNDQIEESYVQLLCRDKKGEDSDLVHEARNVRVLDSDPDPRSPAHCLGCKGGSVHHTCGKAPDADCGPRVNRA